MKKSAFSVLVLACALLVCGQAFAADNPVTIRLGNFNANGEPGQAASLLFAERANKYSNGSITVEVHNNSEFGNAPEMAEQVSIGAIEACLICEATLGEYDSRYHLVAMPYLYDSYEHAYRVVDGEFKKWVADGTLESKGIHDVGSWEYGFRSLTNSKVAIKHPDQVKGLLIRTPSEQQLIFCMEALGANVQQVNFSELIPALKQKTVDGQENPISTIYNNALWECEQKYLTLTKHEWESMNLCINNDFWEKLSDAQRAAIEKASAEASAFMRKTVQDSEADYLKKLAEKGMQVIEVNIDEFRANMQYAYDKMVSTGAVTQEQVDKMMEMVKNAR
ncbi:MAG: TRAP transporter substrate-binding protein [Fretibacterium sp.]|nr:TRAP transporter substrate-binding protein [Fretibacterium sp.]